MCVCELMEFAGTDIRWLVGWLVGWQHDLYVEIKLNSTRVAPLLTTQKPTNTTKECKLVE